MWQKARILKAGKEPSLVGRTLWTVAMEPFVASYPYTDGSGFYEEFSVETNVVAAGLAIAMPLKNLELLPEFADAVPTISLEDFCGR